MFELEDYSSSIHEGFFSKYAVSTIVRTLMYTHTHVRVFIQEKQESNTGKQKLANSYLSAGNTYKHINQYHDICFYRSFSNL